MSIEFTAFEPAHIQSALKLWSKAEGIGLTESDTADQIGRFLERNPGFSWVALRGGSIVGAVLCGHDGRRGYIHHLAVTASERRAGIGRALVERCLSRLREAGILKCHAFVYRTNQFGELFWGARGWERRDDLHVFSHLV
jgi:ribosomal protein S18 acetylase RimI-like enzyme